MILTSEAVATKQDARNVVRYYERRWLIEEFHKSWKSGCRIEQRPVQAVENLERLAIITAQVAVRLLQLRFAVNMNPEQACDSVLSQEEWECLWGATEPNTRIPRHAPPVLWALHAIARLAGWRDTKRTGRIGWATLWKGWAKLQDRVSGLLQAQRASQL